MKTKNREEAVFGGGCFWCIETMFSRLKGVASVTSGYAGGTRKNPSYEQVSSGATGHAEVIKIIFDPTVISYQALLDVFFHTHDPTTLNRQGADAGEQYRSVILYASPEQKKAAKEAIEKLTKEQEFKNPIITEVKPLEAFYEGESDHQDYYRKNPQSGYCQLVIAPKLEHFQERYKKLLKG